MTWSLQLTPWALPPLLAVLLAARDLEYLLARRREPAVRALAVLMAVGGGWALLHLVAIVSPTPSSAALLPWIEGVAAAAAPVAWLWFALTYSGRGQGLRRWPAWLLYGVSTVTVVLALEPTARVLLVRSAGVVRLDGVLGLRVERGPWAWVETLASVAAVAVGTVAMIGPLSRVPGSRLRAGVAALAGLVVLGAITAHVGWSPTADWKDLTPTAFGVASALLGAGLLRRRLLTLGPVARTLVMVEIQDPIVVLDGKGRIVDANHAAERVLGLRPYGDVPVPLGTLWAKATSTAEAPARIRLDATMERGTEERAFDVTVTSLHDRGAPGRSAFVLRDVTSLLQAQSELEELARTDALTGLANRRHFMEALAREVERARRYGHSLSLVLIDLDRFKDVNDTHGHAAGDDVLRATAAILREVSRDVDVAARIGGEELVLLLPETRAAGARSVAERVRRRIEASSPRSQAGEAFRVTASLGVASYAGGAETPEEILQACDAALYRAKGAGRNRVVVERPTTS